MEDANYFKRQEELMKLKEELRTLKRNKDLAPLRNQLKGLHEAYNGLEENITQIATNVTVLNETASALRPVLDYPVKINVGKDNVVKVKRVIESVPQITSDIHNVNIPQENELLKRDKMNFQSKMFSCQERHRRFCDSSALLILNVEQLTKSYNDNVNEISPTEDLQAQHQSQVCNNFSGDSISFSTTNVIASSPMSCRKSN